jgi:uncharacterized repeat protein (TIGR01451 family)
MSRALTRGTRVLAVAVALILAIGILQPRVASAQTIMLNPTSGPAGTQVVNVTGSGYMNGELVNVTFAGFGTVATATATGAGGSIATQFTVPGAATPGMYQVTATGATSGRTASQPFQVTVGPATTLSIAKSVTVAGNVLNYQITYQNNGPNPATGVVITDQLASGQSLRIFSLSAGCTYNTAPSGIVTVTCTPNPTGTPGTVPPSPQAGSSGSFSFSTQVNAGFCGTIPNNATISSNNAGSVTSNTTTVTVGSCQPGPTSLQKLVEDNQNGFFSTGVNANPGDVLTYDIAYINSSTTTTSPNVVVTDTLQPGQSYLGPPFSSNVCAPISANTISCSLGNVPPNTRVDVFIGASVNSNVPGAIITNQAAATSGGTTIYSNTTTVQVGGTSPPPFNFTGNFILCGVVTSYTGTSVTVSGVTVSIVPGAAVSGPVTVGANECITFALNSSAQATALAVSSNLAGVGVACGTYGGTSAGGVLNVSGIGIPLAPTASFQPFLVPGGFFCFLLNGSGQAYAILSGVPTSLENAAGGGHAAVGAEKYL